jgi:DNA repair photolyase
MAAKGHKGRGAISRIAGRFEKTLVELCDEEAFAKQGDAPPTELRAMQAASIISKNSSPDVPFDRSINPYQGCEHGCVYCYARPSHSYLDLSPGLDFESKVFYKPNAVERLLEVWEKRGYECKPITIGANTDPYQPAEKKLGITRRLLEAFLEYRHPVSLISKSGLMSRDLDLIEALAAGNLCSVAISIPTMDRSLKRMLEPRVPSAGIRIRLIEELKAAGVPTSLLMAPIIPAVNDREIESIVAKAVDAGVDHATYIFLRLPHEVRDIFVEWLETHMPERAEHVMSLVRQASGGRDYDNRFGIRQRGRGPYAEMISKRFRAACRKHGLEAGRYRNRLD